MATKTPSDSPKLPYAIRSISITDFRGIEHLELDFCDPRGEPNQIVVLGGANGAGKTAVLEACLLAGRAKRMVRGPVGQDAVRIGSQGYSLEIDVRLVNAGGEFAFSTLGIDLESFQVIRYSVDGKTISYADLNEESAGYFADSTSTENHLNFSYANSSRMTDLPGSLGISAKSEEVSDSRPRLRRTKQRIIDLAAAERLRSRPNGPQEYTSWMEDISRA